MIKPVAPKHTRLVTEEATLENLQTLRQPTRALAVGAYLLASFWPWWMTFFVPALLLAQFVTTTRVFVWASIAFGVLAFGGMLAKQFFERHAERWAKA